MENLSASAILVSLCGLIVLSYFFSVIHRVTRIPSVILLMGTGVALRYLTDSTGSTVAVPGGLVEVLGTVGLIMIVLEAGLDLEFSREKLVLIRRAFLSAVIILLVSTLGVAALIKWWIAEAPIRNCLVYAIALSVISSTIVLSSVAHLSESKREFLVYEASFSDVLGIMSFNFLADSETFDFQSFVWFGSSIVVALVLSVLLCFGLMLLLVKSRVNVKFFLLFAVLVIVYVGGKMMHLPALLTILMFGLVVNNWELIRLDLLKNKFSDEVVNHIATFLKSITAESAFLIRTFFFVIFGYGIHLGFISNQDVLILGASIVGMFILLRFIYLRILNKYNLFPEIFYVPRGLITVLLFYKIPDALRILRFDEGVLFFVILCSSVVMMLGTMFYREKPLIEVRGSMEDLGV